MCGMFISPEEPQVDMVSLRGHVFTLATADSAPWFFKLNHTNTALAVQRSQLRDMSFYPLSSNSGWPQQLAKRSHQPLPAYGTGYCPDPEQLSGDMSLVVEDNSQTSIGNRASISPISTAFHYPPDAEQTGISHALGTNIPVLGPHEFPLGSAYWHLVPHGSPASVPFAHGGEPVWNDTQDSGQSFAGYQSDYAFCDPAGSLSQTVFRRAPDTLHSVPLTPVPEGDSSASSIIHSSSDLAGTAVLGNEPIQTTWDVSSETKSTVRKEPDCCIQAVTGSETISCDTWANCEPEGPDETTVSPKMLRICQTPTPSSSSPSSPSSPSSTIRDSVHTSYPADTRHSELSEAPIDPALANSHGRAKREKQKDYSSTRRAVFRSTAAGDTSTRRRRSSDSARSCSFATPRRLTRLRPKPGESETAAVVAAMATTTTMPPAPTQTLPLLPSQVTLRSQTQLRRGGGKERSAAVLAAVPVSAELADRMSKDEFLVRQKQMGRTYKEIRRLGGFTEAESTLRGRYRTLTKCREARVRKPEWSETDLRLLERGVRELAHTPDLNPTKVPWKRVAEYIVAHGGSYHFGNSTCRKRWDELVREQTARGKSLHQPFFDDDDYNGGSGGHHGRGGFLA
ncbi:hypothetical protein VTH82DRAFT_1366 [Thermothelomyces myriococcoides]